MEPKRKKVKYYKRVRLDENQLESPEDPGYSSISGDGWFHEWGKDFVSMYSDGEVVSVTQVTVAIVEDCSTGKCFNIHPDDIIFLTDHRDDYKELSCGCFFKIGRRQNYQVKLGDGCDIDHSLEDLK